MTSFCSVRKGREGERAREREDTGKFVEEQSCPLVESRVAHGQEPRGLSPPEYETGKRLGRFYLLSLSLIEFLTTAMGLVGMTGTSDRSALEVFCGTKKKDRLCD